jgi:hypothetical protein
MEQKQYEQIEEGPKSRAEGEEQEDAIGRPFDAWGRYRACLIFFAA